MGWAVQATSRPLYPLKGNAVPILSEGGWVPEPVWTDVKNLAPAAIRCPDRPDRSEQQYRLNWHCLIHLLHRYEYLSFIFSSRKYIKLQRSRTIRLATLLACKICATFEIFRTGCQSFRCSVTLDRVDW
jgi:hypothetical protein